MRFRPATQATVTTKSGMIKARTMQAAAILLAICVSGCGGDNPGSWPIDKVEAQVMIAANLSEIELSPGGTAGVLAGTGKDEGGETFQITVTQNAETKQFDWEAKGDRGSNQEGMYGR